MKYTLLFAPIPALVGSIFLMRFANVASIVWIQQLVFAFLALLVCVYAIRKSQRTFSKSAYFWIVLVSISVLLIPLFLEITGNPKRWLNMVGFRLYVSAVILPSILVFLASAGRHSGYSKSWIYFAYIAVALTLALQPDASQLTAFAIAAAITLFINKSPLFAKMPTLLALLLCMLWGWNQPDPLEPVLYVEGVLELAMSISPLALAVAILGLAIPVIGLVQSGISTGRKELFVAAIYYILIFCLAGMTQLTPMPLLGFGAGPIFGYFFLTYVITRLPVVDTVCQKHQFDRPMLRSRL